MQKRSFVFVLLLNICLFSGFSSVVLAQMTDDPRWTNYRQDDGLSSNDVWSILVDDNSVWFGTSNGISRFNGIWKRYPGLEIDGATDPIVEGYASPEGYAPAGRVQALARSDIDGTIWAGTDLGHISRWDGQRWHQMFKAEYPIHALQPLDSWIWVGTDNGLERFDISDPFSEPYSVTKLIGNPVYTLFIPSSVNLDATERNEPNQAAQMAESNRLWAGTEHGLWYRQGTIWSLYEPTQNGDATWHDMAVHTLWMDTGGRLWIGILGGVIKHQLGTPGWTLISTRDLWGEPVLVQALQGDKNGEVWATTDGGGIRHFKEQGAITVEFSRSIAGNLQTDFVRDVAVDTDGALWFATPVGVLKYATHQWLYDPDNVQSLNGIFGPAGLFEPSHDIRDFLIDQEGVLWMATGQGVRIKGGPGESDSQHFDMSNSGLVDNAILALAEDSQGGIWAGTFHAGVTRYHNGAWQTPIETAQLPSPIVGALFADDEHIWIGTEAGLASYNLIEGTLWIEEEVMEHIVDTIVLDSQKRLWVGTKTGGIWIRHAQNDWERHTFDSIWQSAGIRGPTGVFHVALAADPRLDGGMWAAIDQAGLFRWDGHRWHWMDSSNALPTNFISTLFVEEDNGTLWIGHEIGVTRYDGESWGTLRSEDGLRGTPIDAIARTPEGDFWFGGQGGLSFYRPEWTVPWLKIGTVHALNSAIDDGILTTHKNQIIRLDLVAGDLQTPQEKLKLYYRWSDGEQIIDWRLISQWHRPFEIQFDAIGEYLIEFRARDQSFNYSKIATQLVKVEPVLAPFRFLGMLEIPDPRTYLTFIALSVLAILGFGYVSLEVLHGQRRIAALKSRNYNPYVSGEPVRDADMFFGRHDLLRRIVDTLHNNSIMIHGERRIGKTTLLYQLANRLQSVDDPHYWFLPIYIDLEGTSQDLFFHVLMEEITNSGWALNNEETSFQSIYKQLLYTQVPDREYTDRKFGRDLRQMIAILQSYGNVHYPDKQLRIILLIDEIDVMSQYDQLIQQQLRRIFMRDFAVTLGAVVAGIQISHKWSRVESPWFNLFNEIRMEPFTNEQAMELLTEPIRNFYTYEPEALTFIIEQSQGRPFRLQQYGMEAVGQMLTEKRNRIKLSDVHVAHQAIQNRPIHPERFLAPVPITASKNGYLKKTGQNFSGGLSL